MKKIGILTFQRTSNYGAIMQCYALNRKINDLGARAETLDYHCKALEKKEKIKITKPKTVLKLMYQMYKQKRCNRFIKKEVRMSKEYFPETIDKADYDAFIVGSDQVWNPKCTNDDKNYYLCFNNNASKYSYAASIGLEEEKAMTILEKNKKYLSEFSKISLREYLNIDNEKVRYDIDPVFLLNKDQWKNICSKKLLRDKYVFVYTIGDPIKIDEFTKELAKKENLKIISNKKSFEFICNCSPYDFLSWIYNAEYIITNSFHGTAFSIIFNKKFYAECEGKNGVNTRILNLLKLLNKEECILKEDCFNVDNNYKETNELVERNVQLSNEYLKEILK